MTLLERTELSIKCKPISYGKMQWFISLVQAIEQTVLLWLAAVYPTEDRQAKRKHTVEKKTHSFLLFPFLSRWTLLWGPNQGLVTIGHMVFSMLAASKNQKLGESVRIQLVPERLEFLWWMPSHMAGLPSMKIWYLKSRPLSPQINKNLLRKKNHKAPLRIVYFISLAKTLAVRGRVVGINGDNKNWGARRY